MQKISLILLCTIGFVSACNKEQSYEIQHIDNTVLNNAEWSLFDTCSMGGDFLLAESFYPCNDSMCIIVNQKKENEPFLLVYNRKKESISKQMLVCGKGHEEALSFHDILFENNLLSACDYVTRREFFINVDSLLRYPNYQIECHSNLPFCGVLNFSKFNGKIIGENFNRFKNEELKINQDYPRLFYCDDSTPENYIMKDGDYDLFNINNGGQIVVNEKRQKILYANRTQPIIEISDAKLNIIKEIYFDKLEGIDYVIFKNKLIYKKRLPVTFASSCKNEKYVYLFYVNNFWDAIKNDLNNGLYYILKLDWDGNVVNCYKTDHYLYSLSYLYESGTDSGHLYATIHDDEGDSWLVKFKNID